MDTAEVWWLCPTLIGDAALLRTATAEREDEVMPSNVQRGVGRPFRPGTSGNPGGRPKAEAHVRNLARQNSLGALQCLIALIDSADPRVALMAAKEVLDRAHGKPVPEVSHDDKLGVTVRIVRLADAATSDPANSHAQFDGGGGLD